MKIKVEVIRGSHQSGIRECDVGRVPSFNEHIEFEDVVYRVVEVIHIANATDDQSKAFVRVSD